MSVGKNPKTYQEWEKIYFPKKTRLDNIIKESREKENHFDYFTTPEDLPPKKSIKKIKIQSFRL